MTVWGEKGAALQFNSNDPPDAEWVRLTLQLKWNTSGYMRVICPPPADPENDQVPEPVWSQQATTGTLREGLTPTGLAGPRWGGQVGDPRGPNLGTLAQPSGASLGSPGCDLTLPGPPIGGRQPVDVQCISGEPPEGNWGGISPTPNPIPKIKGNF